MDHESIVLLPLSTKREREQNIKVKVDYLLLIFFHMAHYSAQSPLEC